MDLDKILIPLKKQRMKCVRVVLNQAQLALLQFTLPEILIIYDHYDIVYKNVYIILPRRS